MYKCFLGFLLVISLFTVLSIAQTAPPSDPQAVALVAQSVLAMTGGTPIGDGNLTGTAVWTAGSDRQTGTVTLLAKGFAESRVDLNLGGGTKSEIRNSNASPDEGNWIGPDSVVHAIAQHNCFTDSSWFFPALGSLASAATNPNVVLTYVGLESSLQHIHVYTYDAQLPDAQQLSAMDFYLDPQSLLPQVVMFNEHPDENPTVNIGVEAMFLDYRNVNGAAIPFHIQRYVNNSLMLDVQLTSATV